MRIQAIRTSLYISEHDSFRLTILAFGNDHVWFEEYDWEMDRLLGSVERTNMLIARTLTDLSMVRHANAPSVSAQLLTLQNLLAPIVSDPRITGSSS